MTTFEKLAVKISSELGYDIVNPRRTYAGPNLLGSGAWSWTAEVEGTTYRIGSSDTATYLNKKNVKLETLRDWRGLGKDIEIIGEIINH